MLPIAAYANRLSVRPGETIRFHAANATQTAVATELVRVICADANPAGPGIQTDPVASTVSTIVDPVQDVRGIAIFDVTPQEFSKQLDITSKKGWGEFCMLAIPIGVDGRIAVTIV